ncbi:heterokaryon incompatibility protein-domain-containing protein [Cadophora sp. MPI-SDFR-AT-0126]|nr:heterokaryon incompatibility protein-domain-containing protein [Leotiomycetes sp. MPI-SDFR-AT-0126]
MAQFQYHPLNPSKNEIRILRPVLQPGQHPHSFRLEGGDPHYSTIVNPDLSLEFELLVASLDDKPEFTALSYVWGDPAGVSPIQVDSRQLLVAKNLGIALHHLAYQDIAPALWVDSICINQNDDVEKGDQVGRMRHIFSSASRVINWLGEGSHKSDLVADAIYAVEEEICRKFNVPKHKRYEMLEYMDFDTESELIGFLNATFRSNSPLAHMPLYDILRDFLVVLTRRLWWYRVWVVQELVVAREPTFQIGRRKIGFGGLSTMALIVMALTIRFMDTSSEFQGDSKTQALDQYVGFINSGQRGAGWMMQMFICREQYHGRRKKANKVIDILIRSYVYLSPPRSGFDNCLAARDPKDYIYGLLSLFKENYSEIGMSLPISYERTWEDLHGEVAQHLIEAGHLDVLSLNQKQMPLLDPVLPTWAPPWHKLIITPHMDFKTGARAGKSNHSYATNSLFSASSSKSAIVSFAISTTDDHSTRSMHIEGVLVDHILTVGTVQVRSFMEKPTDINVIGLSRELQAMIQHSRKYSPETYTITMAKEAVWRIICRDIEYPEDTAFDPTKDDEFRRATHVSGSRFRLHLPFFKALMAHDKAIRVLQESSKLESRLGRVAGWLYSRPYLLTAKIYTIWFNIRKVAQNYAKAFRYWVWPITHPLGIDNSLRLLHPPGLGLTKTFDSHTMRYLATICTGPKVVPFVTRHGYVGLGPGYGQEHTRPGDLICIFYGARVPFVLRPRPDGQTGYILVGEAFVYGIMDGEIMTMDHQTMKFQVF